MGTTSKKRSKKQAGVDWSLAPRGPVSATVQTGLGLLAASAVGYAVHLNPIWGLGAAAVGALGTVMVSAHRDTTPTALGYRLVCWCGGGGWLTWTLVVSPWHRETLVTLLVGGGLAGITARFATHSRPPGQQPGTAVVLSGGGKTGRSWAERIYRVCRVRVTVTDVRHWDTGTGYDIHVDLPPGGATRDSIARCADGLASDARLPEGCGVEVGRGTHRGSLVLRVATVNRLLENIDQPDDHSPRSILDAVDLGEYRDGSTVSAPLRELAALVIGQRGSGKTNLLDLFTHGIGRCVDALVWHIDLNGGGMSQAWLHPWLEGETDRPAIDWAACTRKEALLMVEAAVAIAKDRKRSYRKLKIQENSRLLPISARLPEIVIIVDEGKTVLAPGTRGIIGEIRARLIEIQDIARDAAVNIVASGLRATSDTIDTQLKVQAGLRIGMPVEKDAELAYLFDWNKGISLADLPTMGCAFIQYGFGAETPRVFKTRLMKPRQIVQAAVAIAERRPDLDAAGIAAAGDAYANRYARMREAFTGDLVDEDEADDIAYGALPAQLPASFDDVKTGGTAGVVQGVPVPRRDPAAGNAAAWPSLNGAAGWADPNDLAAADARRTVLVGAAEWPDMPTAGATTQTLPRPAAPVVADDGRSRVHASRPHPQVGPSPRPIPQILTDLVAIFIAHGADRLHTKTIVALLAHADPDLTDKRFSLLMGPCNIAPVEAWEDPATGTRGRGYVLADIQTAIGAIHSGSHIPPRAVYEWPPTH